MTRDDLENADTVAGIVITGDDEPAVRQNPTQWAVDHLIQVVRTAGAAAERAEPADAVPRGSLRVVLAGAPTLQGDIGDPPGVAAAESAGAASPESFAITRPTGEQGPVVLTASHGRGLAYALLELADRAQHSADPIGAIRSVPPSRNSPATPVRGILRTFACEVEDKPWFYDRDFWSEFLTELATQRINRFQLALGMQYNYPHHPATDNYFCFPYPFLLDVPGYDVRAGDLSTAEQDRNLAMLQFISAEAERRGIHFQLGLWNSAFDQGEGSVPRYPIQGLDATNHASYCAAAVSQLLHACPAIAGLTLRVHYEGGIPEPEHEDFWRPVMQSVAAVGRPIELDMHAKGVDEAMLDIARETGLPFLVSAKYWAEHQGLPYHQTSIREKEKSTGAAGTGLMAITAHQRRFTRYGYGDFLKENRDYGLLFRIWPGTQRVLLWGDPALAAGYGRMATLGGAMGVELCEPLTFKGRMDTGEPGGRDPYLDPALRLDGAEWKKYRYTYRLWGRLLYDPEADPDSWRRFLRSQFGAAAAAVEAALAPASRVLPLVTVVHGLGASNNGYWPEIYLNMPIAGGPNADHYARDTASPPTFGGVSSFDPSLFYRIDEYADDLMAGRRDGRYPPDVVDDWLESLADDAEQSLASATGLVADADDPSFRRVAVDVAAQAGLGRFFAGKLCAGLAYSLFERTHDLGRLDDSVRAYRAARDAFAAVAQVTTGVYRDDLTFGTRASEHGHWAGRLPDIEADLADLERRYADAQAEAGSAATVPIPAVPRADRVHLDHTPPKSFRPGQDVVLEVGIPDPETVASIDLRYRHLNQAEEYQQVEMVRSGSQFSAQIPGTYTDTEYPLVYFFVVHHPAGDAWIMPGLDADLANQPYHVIRQAPPT